MAIVCRVLQLLTIAAAAFVLYAVYYSFTQSFTPQYVWADVSLLSQDQANLVIVSDFKTDVLKGLRTVGMVTLLFVLLGVFRIFGVVANRPVNLQKAMKVIRFLGLMVMLKAFVDALVHPAILLTMTYDNPPGQRALAVNFDPQIITWFLLGIAVFVAGNAALSTVRRRSDTEADVAPASIASTEAE